MGSLTFDEIVEKAYEEAGLTEEDVLGDKGFIPSGNLALDFILGGQGFPRGRSVELYGLSQSGKTTTAAMIAVQAQRMGQRVFYLDFEQALDEPYLQALGVNTRDRKLFVPFPAGSLEHGAEVATQVARTGEVGLIVFDSVAAMTPRSSAEDDKDSRTLAMERARLLGNLLSKLNPILARTGTCAVFINHIRDVIETGPTRPGMPKRTTTPGGTALKFYSSVRVKFTVVKTLKADRVDPLTGEKISDAHSVLSRAEVTKNKLAAPYQSAELYLELGRGFNNTYSAMQVLVGNKIVKKSGAFYFFPDDLYHPNMSQGAKGPSMQGMQSVLDLAETFPNWSGALVARAVAALPSEKVTVSLPGGKTVVGERAVKSEFTRTNVPDIEPGAVTDEAPATTDDEDLIDSDESLGVEPPPIEVQLPAPVTSNGQTIRFAKPSGVAG